LKRSALAIAIGSISLKAGKASTRAMVLFMRVV
jgi:hypothetical protein